MTDFVGKLKSQRRATLVFLISFCIIVVFMVSANQRTLTFAPEMELVRKNKTTSGKTTQNSNKNDVTSGYMTSHVIQPMLQNNTVNYPLLQKERIDRIKRTCKNQDLFKGIYRKNQTEYYYSRKYNFLYCKVPKSGSTFWTQTFNILENGVSSKNNIFNIERYKVHTRTKNFAVKVKESNLTHVSAIVVSRDPFSRLYSAFIDKFYLLLDIDGTFAVQRYKNNISKNKTQCPLTITFQDFLDYIIFQASRGEMLNRHWSPINNICTPCDINAYILVKQESFSEDVETAMKVFDVEQKKYDVIMGGLRGHRIEYTIPGIVETVFEKSVRTLKKCKMLNEKARKTVIERLWNAFKIQGFLQKDLPFPSQNFSTYAQYNAQHLTEVIFESINSHLMTSSEMKSQRHQALINGYKSISKITIEGVKDIYEVDFEMFGYSRQPPS